MLYHCHFKKQLIYILQFSVILFIYCRIKFLVSFIYCYINFLNVTYFFFLFLFCSLSLILYQIVHIELLFHVTHLCFYESSQHANFVISVLVKVKSQKFSKPNLIQLLIKRFLLISTFSAASCKVILILFPSLSTTPSYSFFHKYTFFKMYPIFLSFALFEF